MADFDLGTARGKIELENAGAKRAIDETEGGIHNLGRTSRTSSGDLLALGGALTAVGVAAAAGLGVAIRSAADFEQKLSAIKAVSGATAEEMEKLRAKALQLGADTKFSAGESASAMEELIKAGLNVEDVLNGAADATVALAAAGEVDLTTAATIASNAMNQFALSAEEMPHIADLIAGAANASAIDVNEFGLSMQQAGAVANLAGLSFDDLAVAIAAMGNAGIRGSDAGTSLKTFLQNLQPTTAKQTELFKELGLITADNTNLFYDQNGSLKSLRDVSQILQDSMAGMTDQQKQMTLETLFGSDAIRAAAVISNEGAAGFDALAASIGQVSAADVAATRMDNLNGSIEQLKGSFETLLIVVGTPFLGFIRQAVDGLTGFVNMLATLTPEQQKWIGIIGGSIAALSTLIGSLLILQATAQKVRTVMLALNASFLTNPFVLVIAALVALGAALYIAYQRSETFRKIVDDTWTWIQANVLPIIDQVWRGMRALIEAFNGEGITSDGFVGFMERVGVAARQVYDFFVDDLIPAFIDFGTTVIRIGGQVASWIDQHVMPVFIAFGELVVAVVNRAINIWNRLWPVIQVVLNIIQGAIATFVAVAIGIWETFGNKIWTVIEISFNIMRSIVEAVLGIIQGIIQFFTGVISGDWEKAWEGIRTIFSSIWDFIAAIPGNAMAIIQLAIRTALDGIQALWKAAWESVQIFFSTLWETIKGIVSAALINIKMTIGSALDGIIAWFRALPGNILGAVGDGFGLLLQWGRNIISGAWQGIREIWDTAIAWIRGIPGRILDAIPNPLELLRNVGRDIVQGLINGIKSLAGSAVDAVKDIGGGLVGGVKGVLGIGSPSKVFAQLGEWTIEGLVLGLKDLRPLTVQVEAIAGTMRSPFDSGGSTVPMPLAAVGGGDINITLNFPGITNAAEAEGIRSALNDPSMLAELIRTLKVGRR